MLTKENNYYYFNSFFLIDQGKTITITIPYQQPIITLRIGGAWTTRLRVTSNGDIL